MLSSGQFQYHRVQSEIAAAPREVPLAYLRIPLPFLQEELRPPGELLRRDHAPVQEVRQGHSEASTPCPARSLQGQWLLRHRQQEQVVRHDQLLNLECVECLPQYRYPRDAGPQHRIQRRGLGRRQPFYACRDPARLTGDRRRR